MQRVFVVAEDEARHFAVKVTILLCMCVFFCLYLREKIFLQPLIIYSTVQTTIERKQIFEKSRFLEDACTSKN